MSLQRGAVAVTAGLAVMAWATVARPASTEIDQAAASVDEPIEYRLLRTLQIGSPQGVTAEEMLAYADGNEADYLGHVLARAAVTVLGEDRGFPDWPLERLLERTLAQLQRGVSPAYNLPDAMPDGFRGEHLVLATVYALVVSGQEEKATDVLEAQLASGSSFKRGVILQALRNIGTDREPPASCSKPPTTMATACPPTCWPITTTRFCTSCTTTGGSCRSPSAIVRA